MSSAPRTFRVFVSSTFSDMRAERRLLQQEIFPRLERLCASQGASFQAVDLRWGINEDAQLDHRTMEICLNEVARCQRLSPKPNFIILIGDKYGWQPLPSKIPSQEMVSVLGRIRPDVLPHVKRWYREDFNAVPAEYCLQPREGAFRSLDEWRPMEQELRVALREAVSQLDFTPGQRIKYFASATHQEIIQGALNPPAGAIAAEEHVFAYMRRIRDLPDGPEARDYIDLASGHRDEDSRERLESLKRELRGTAGRPGRLPVGHIYDYGAKWDHDCVLDDLAAFGERVYGDLHRVIQQQLNEAITLDAAAEETMRHEKFLQERVEHFTGREEILDAILRYAVGDGGQVLSIIGPSGCGKTSILAKGLELARKSPVFSRNDVESRGVSLVRFIGTTSGTSKIHSLLAQITAQIASEYGVTLSSLLQEGEDRARFGTVAGLMEMLTRCFALASERRPLLIFLDALDQLSVDDLALAFASFPWELPPNVRVVVSGLPTLREKLSRSALCEVGAMSAESGARLLGKWLAATHRTLQEEQRVEVVQAFAGNGSPLYLKLAFERLRTWPSYAGTPALGPDTDRMLHDYFDGLEKAHGAPLVRTFCGLLLSGRYQGLTERELLDLLALNNGYWEHLVSGSHPDHREEIAASRRVPAAIWSRLLLDLKPYLGEKDAAGLTLIAFYHRQFGDHAGQRYRTGDNVYHVALADYFEQRWQGRHARAIDELPWQLCEAAAWPRLYTLLADPGFLATVGWSGEPDLQRFWRQIEAHSDLSMIRAYEPVFKAGEKYVDLVALIEALLDNAGHLGESVGLWQQLLASIKDTGNLDQLQGVLGNAGVALYESGEIEGAMQLYQEQERVCRKMGLRRGGAFGLQASLGNQAEVHLMRGEMNKALKLFREQEAICREIGNRDGLQHSLGNQGGVMCAMGKYRTARQLYQAQREVCQETGDVLHRQLARCGEAYVDSLCGRLDGALATLQECEAAFRDLGNKKHLIHCLALQGEIFFTRGDAKACAERCAEAEAIGAGLRDHDLQARLSALKGHLLRAGRNPAEALRMYQEEERGCRVTGARRERVKALLNQADALGELGDWNAALQISCEAERVAREIGSSDGLADSLRQQAGIRQAQGDPIAALKLLESAEAGYRESGNQNGLAGVLLTRAAIGQGQGRYREALAFAREAESIYRGAGISAGVAVALGSRGLILRACGRPEDAMELHQEEMRICRGLGDRDGIARSLGNQAVLLKELGDLDGALRLHADEERISRELGAKDRIQVSVGNQAVIYALRGEFDRAMTLQKEKERLCRELGNRNSLATSLGNQANIHHERGELEEAIRLYRQEEQICRELGDPAKLAACLCNQASANYGMNQFNRARRLAEEAFVLARRYELPLKRHIAELLEHL